MHSDVDEQFPVRPQMSARPGKSLDVIETRIMPEELTTFNECFIVGSAAEVTPVAEIGPYKFTPGNISRTLMDSYSKTVRG